MSPLDHPELCRISGERCEADKGAVTMVDCVIRTTDVVSFHGTCQCEVPEHGPKQHPDENLLDNKDVEVHSIMIREVFVGLLISIAAFVVAFK